RRGRWNWFTRGCAPWDIPRAASIGYDGIAGGPSWCLLCWPGFRSSCWAGWCNYCSADCDRHKVRPRGLTTEPNPRTQQSNQPPFRIMACQMTAGEDIAVRRKKLRYRAWHRGTREMDLVLGPFADAHTEAMDAVGLDRLEALMSEEDPPLLTWVMGQVVPPDHIDRDFLTEVIADHQARLAQ